jgi:hypothetical protein
VQADVGQPRDGVLARLQLIHPVYWARGEACREQAASSRGGVKAAL